MLEHRGLVDHELAAAVVLFLWLQLVEATDFRKHSLENTPEI